MAVTGERQEDNKIEEGRMKEKGRMDRQDKIAKASCTGEGINYVLECITCRRKGVKRRYYGESGRSGYQRGREHMREIREGIMAHPMVSHFWEEHNGRRQEIIMRITSNHLTPLEWHVQESII